MKPIRLFRPSLESLEERYCPTLSILQVGSTLLISGTPRQVANQTVGIQINETSQGLFAVFDSTTSKGTFPASNIVMNLTTRTNAPVDINLMGNSLTGNLQVNVGPSLYTGLGPAVKGFGIQNGTIGGNITYTGGAGAEFLYLGPDFAGHNGVGGAGNLRIGGSVVFSPKPGNFATTANQLATAGANIITGFGGGAGTQTTTTIGGNVVAANVSGFYLGGTSTVGGNVTDSAGSVNNLNFANFVGTVNKNVIVKGSLSGGSNLYIGADANPAAGLPFAPGSSQPAVIKGSLIAELGAGLNPGSAAPGGANFILGGGSVISGDAKITSIGTSYIYTVTGQVAGSMSVNMGQGANQFTFNAAAIVDGDLNVIEGNGGNLATLFAGAVNGNLTFAQGNGGTNAVPQVTTLTGSVAGTFTYSVGNGAGTLNITPAAATLYNVNLNLGTNSATPPSAYILTLNGNDVLTGTITGHGGSHTFNQSTATLLPSLQLFNWP